MAAIDTFEGYARGRDSLWPSGAYLLAASFDADNDLAYVSRGFIPTTSGTLKFTTSGDNDLAIPVSAGVYYPYEVRRIWDTGSSGVDGVLLGW